MKRLLNLLFGSFLVMTISGCDDETMELRFDFFKQVNNKTKVLEGRVIEIFKAIHATNEVVSNIGTALHSSVTELRAQNTELMAKLNETIEKVAKLEVALNDSIQSCCNKESKCPANIGPNSSCHSRADPFYCYCFVYNETSWTKANDLCLSHGMRLVSVETAGELALLKQLVKDDGITKILKGRGNWLWTSGSDRDQEGKWVWTATGMPVTYFNWWPDQPDNAKGEDYLHMNFNDLLEWNDIADEPTSVWGLYFTSFPLCEL